LFNIFADLTINVCENVTNDESSMENIENIENVSFAENGVDYGEFILIKLKCVAFFIFFMCLQCSFFLVVERSGTWEHPAIMLLFCLYKDHLALFKNDKIRNDTVWKKIADCLNEKGYTYTIKQIENKWKNLRKNYIKVKDNNSKSGASFKKCKYYDEMEEIYGKSHSVQPVATASNLSQKNVLSISTDEEQKSDEECNVVPPKKTKMEKQLHVLTEYMEKNEKAKERRHKERLEYQKEAVETYKQLMSKLLEKL